VKQPLLSIFKSSYFLFLFRVSMLNTSHWKTLSLHMIQISDPTILWVKIFYDNLAITLGARLQELRPRVPVVTGESPCSNSRKVLSLIT